MFELSSLQELFTVVGAGVGCILGILNTWQGLNQNRVKLKVIPKAAYRVSADGILSATQLTDNTGYEQPDLVCIEVTNLSGFPVTVSGVGFTINGDPRTNPRRELLQPIVIDGGQWPRRLEARTSVSVYAPFKNLSTDIRKAYAITDCGEVSYGNSPALKWMRNELTA